ncbi:MAG: hypothetical protein ACO3FE_19400, partial [Planctomycetaceae bacterium]
GGWHRQRWVAPATVGGTGKAIRTVGRIVEGTDWFSAGIAIAARLPSHCPPTSADSAALSIQSVTTTQGSPQCLPIRNNRNDRNHRSHLNHQEDHS